MGLLLVGRVVDVAVRTKREQEARDIEVDAQDDRDADRELLQVRAEVDDVITHVGEPAPATSAYTVSMIIAATARNSIVAIAVAAVWLKTCFAPDAADQHREPQDEQQIHPGSSR